MLLYKDMAQIQSKEELEKWHAKSDPWGYESNADDAKRKELILSLLGKYERAIDIGAGDGWITKDLPSDTIHAIEISDNAASRFPDNVTRVNEPQGKYDLVITTGTLYMQYDRERILGWIRECSTGNVLIAGIKEWLPELPKPDKYLEFKYREYTQSIYFYATHPQHWP